MPSMNLRIPARASQHMDLMRGLAAIAVLAGHTRAGLLVDYQEIAHPNVLTKALYFLTGYAHQAVVVFFVLSGFFIGLSVLRSWERWSWRDYMVARLVRLYLVLIPAQLLCALWDNGGIALFGTQNAYGGHLHGQTIAAWLTPAATRLGWSEFLGSITFLSNIVVPDYGSNGVLWSLVCEFWFYLAFPFTLAALARSTPLSQRLLGIAMTVGILWFMGAEPRGYYPVWLAGAALAALLRWEWRPKVPARALQAATALLTAGALVLARTNRLPGERLADLLVTLPFALFLYALQCSPTATTGPAESRYGRFAKWIASFSFTLYVVQAPLGTFLGALFDGPRRQPTLGALAFAGAHVLVTIAYAWGLSRLTEANTERVRAWVSARVRPAVEPA